MTGKEYSSKCMLNSMIIFSILLSSMCISIRGELTDIVVTDKGPIRGEILTTVENRIPYSSFKGIPYGKPPIGNLRFKPPEDAESWDEILLATSEGNRCPQLDYNYGNYTGNEDCLNLNVFTPKTNFEEKLDELMPVMVWIFGGKFKFGYTDTTLHGPDFLIEEKVILVVMNYRLGALGLLALNIPDATGNAALKDQTLAFKWVKRNIMKFGGDPNRVTIFGLSSGSSCIDLHLLSDASRGLFHRSISLSGSPLNPWGFSTPEQAENRAILLANLLGIETTNSSKTEILRQLSQKTAEELVKAAENITKADRAFKPTIENSKVAGDTAFLTECPVCGFKSGKFAQVPHMTGFVSNELLLFAKSVKSLIDYSEFALDSMKEVLQNQVGSNLISFMEKLSNNSNGKLSEFPDSFVTRGIDNLSDVVTITGIDTKQQLMAEFPSAPVYYYRFAFDAGPYSLHRKESHIYYDGIAHSDELPSIFWVSKFKMPLDPYDKPLAIVRKRTVRMFANFAKYGNPTPDGMSDSLLNITWPVSGKQGLHMEIGETLTIGGRPINDQIKIVEEAQRGGILEKLNGCEKE